MLRQTYDLVMDPERNALNALPKTTRYQLMAILAYTWSAIFAVWTGHLMWFGPSAVAHTLILLGLLFTADVFRQAERQKTTHRKPTT